MHFPKDNLITRHRSINMSLRIVTLVIALAVITTKITAKLQNKDFLQNLNYIVGDSNSNLNSKDYHNGVRIFRSNSYANLTPVSFLNFLLELYYFVYRVRP